MRDKEGGQVKTSESRIEEDTAQENKRKQRLEEKGAERRGRTRGGKRQTLVEIGKGGGDRKNEVYK